MDEDHSGLEESNQSQDLSEQLAERIVILRRTQQSVYPSPLVSGGQGNSLADNLERQIRRRHSQLSNLEHSRAEVSVIRHTSTPHEQSRENLNIVGENISGIQAQVPNPISQPPFQIFLDNPDQFHSRTRIVSTDSSSVFSGMANDDPPGLGGPGAVGVGVHQVPDTHEFGVDGVKAELNTKLLELHNLKDVYDPETYEPAVLIDNKAEWISEVKGAYMDVMKCVTTNLTKPETNQEDKVVLNTALNAAKTEFTNFLADFTRKCAVNNGGGAAAAAPGPGLRVQLPQQPILAPQDHSANSSGSSISSVQVQAVENARLANIEVNVTSEKVSDLAKDLSSQIRKFTDCSSVPNHEIEEAMRKINDWEKKVSTIKEYHWEIKTKTLCHGLNNTKLVQTEATVNTVVAEAELAFSNLRHEDSTRCLYSLSESKSANVKYPSFSGADKEDYLKWEKETKAAFIKNQVRLEDQVKILRENLTGHALKLIPHTVTDIDTAFTTLSRMYGEASKVMSTKKDKLFSMGQLPPEARTRSAKHIRDQLEWLVTVENLFEELFEIAEKSEDLNRAFINPDLFKDILDLFPYKVSTHISTIRGGLQTQYESLFTWITKKREELQDTLKLIKSKPEKEFEREKPRNKSANVTFNPLAS